MRTSILCLLLFLYFTALAQDFQIPVHPLSNKEDYTNSEKDVIAANQWLQSTPIGQQMDKRKMVNAWVMMWLTGSPTITINMREPVVKLFEKNADLLLVFLAGYTSYALEHSYSKDEVQAIIAGINAAINCYNLGGDIKKDKVLLKVIDINKEGKLEDWIKDAIKSK